MCRYTSSQMKTVHEFAVLVCAVIISSHLSEFASHAGWHSICSTAPSYRGTRLIGIQPSKSNVAQGEPRRPVAPKIQEIAVLNRVFRIVWNRALNQFVVASELCRSRAKGARSIGGASMIATTKGRLAAGVMLALAGTTGAFAHTTSIGYTNSGNNSLSFYYGTYHLADETTYTEGSLHLTSTAGFDQTVSFDILTGTKPAGLVDGDTNFYSDGTKLIGTPNRVIANWQGVTFNNLVHGTYTFTYIPIANPTQVW